MIAPVSIKFRIDLQELWCLGYGWDDVAIVSEEIQRKWMENIKIGTQNVHVSAPM
jgi:hypothetical protein